MSDSKWNAKISKKAVGIIVISVIVFLLAAITATIAGHTVYENRQEALITNYNTDFKATTPQTLIYLYDDGLTRVDLANAIEVSKGATFSVTKIQDEDGTVTKANGTIIDVSAKPQRLAVVNVVSASGKKSTGYRITVAPESAENNVIDYNTANGELDLNDVFFNYSGEYDLTLPTPVNTYTGASGNTVNFEFQGWYTSPDYAEGTEIEVISKGMSGKIELYAKFASTAVFDAGDGYTYVYYGTYPQSQVTDYNLTTSIKNSDAYKSSGGGLFTYSGTSYYKFTPSNVPNLSENGYSSNATYIFKVEPVEWRVLKPRHATINENETVTLLATSVLNCSSFSSNGGTIQDFYNENVTQNGFDLDGFLKYFYDSDTAYGNSNVKNAVDSMHALMFQNTNGDRIQPRSFTKHKGVLDSQKESYSTSLWLLNYDEAVSENYGFNSDFTVNDNLRKALVSDFGAANGVYRATSRAHLGQGTWWLRGAGDNKYGYKDKRIAYVKYTGYVHAYGASNFEVRSGIRPAMNIRYSANLQNQVN